MAGSVERNFFQAGIPVPVVTVGNNPLPAYAKEGDSGCDGLANITSKIWIMPGERRVVPLGIKAAIPPGFEIQVRPRSGLAMKYGLTVANSPGTVDSGYRDEIGAILINHGTKEFIIEPGMRICQLVLCPVYKIQWETVEELPTSERGLGGFGSTGR